MANTVSGAQTAIPLQTAKKDSDLNQIVRYPTFLIDQSKTWASLMAQFNKNKNSISSQLQKEINGFCCSRSISPIFGSSGFEQKWILPFMKVYIDGKFIIKVSNTDLLNTLPFNDCWLQSKSFIILSEPYVPPQPDVPEKAYGQSFQCPSDAQLNSEIITSDDCPQWVIEEDGKRVVYNSEFAFSVGQQRNTYFHPDTETMYVLMVNVHVFDDCLHKSKVFYAMHK